MASNTTEGKQLNYPLEMELDATTRIMAGFAANPAIFAPNPTCGWELVNCDEASLARYARKLARAVIAEVHKGYIS